MNCDMTTYPRVVDSGGEPTFLADLELIDHFLAVTREQIGKAGGAKVLHCMDIVELGPDANGFMQRRVGDVNTVVIKYRRV